MLPGLKKNCSLAKTIAVKETREFSKHVQKRQEAVHFFARQTRSFVHIYLFSGGYTVCVHFFAKILLALMFFLKIWKTF